MKLHKTGIERAVYYRLAASLVLLGALGMIYSQRSAGRKVLSPEKLNDTGAFSAEIDREIDSVLSGYGIGKPDIKIGEYDLPLNNIRRTERRISVPAGIPRLLMNRSINMIAGRYGARAIGSENLKEKTVNIHVKAGSIIVQSVIIRTSAGRAEKNIQSITKPTRKKTG